jgi:hypothetical protein
MEITFLVDEYQWGDSLLRVDENRNLVYVSEGMVIATQLEMKDLGAFFKANPQDGKRLSRISDGAFYEAIGEVSSETYIGKPWGNLYRTETLLDCGVPIRCFPWHWGKKQVEIGRWLGTVGILFGIIADDRESRFHRPIVGRILHVSKLGEHDLLHQLTIDTQVDENDKVVMSPHWERPRANTRRWHFINRLSTAGENPNQPST